MKEIDGEVFSHASKGVGGGRQLMEGVPITICKTNQSYPLGLSLGLFSS